MMWDEKREARFRIIGWLAKGVLVAAPVLYLAIGYFLDIPRKAGGEYDLMLQILLLVAIFQPLTARVIERFQISMYGKNRQSRMTPDDLFFTLNIIRFALVEAIYLLGLVVYLVSGNYQGMLYFYPIGIIWTFVYWPKRSQYENFVKRIESNVPYAG